MSQPSQYSVNRHSENRSRGNAGASIGYKLFSDSPMEKGMKESHLSIIDYQTVIAEVFVQISKIKQLLTKYEYVERSDDEKLEFRLKKPGFKNLLIFDLDETLIHVMRDQEEVPEDEMEQNLFEPEVKLDIYDEINDQQTQALFSVRPYARACLEFANKYFEVAIFTASVKWFADKIIDYLDPTGTLVQHRFFREATSVLGNPSDEQLFVKDLNIFTKYDLTLDRILIIDNNVTSFALNLSNGIPINDYLGNKKDRSLLQLMHYLDHIKDFDNLRLENERCYELQMIYDSNIEEFAEYYQSEIVCSYDDEEECDYEDYDNIPPHDSVRIKQSQTITPKSDQEFKNFHNSTHIKNNIRQNCDFSCFATQKTAQPIPSS